MKYLAALLPLLWLGCSSNPRTPTQFMEDQGPEIAYSGQVRDFDGQPVDGTAVFLDGNKLTRVLEIEVKDGRYETMLSQGYYWIGIAAPGYLVHVDTTGSIDEPVLLGKDFPDTNPVDETPADEIDDLDEDYTNPVGKSASTQPFKTPILGDVTGFKRVDRTDAKALFDYLLGGRTPVRVRLGDVNADRATDWMDLMLIGQYLTGGPNPYRVGEAIEIDTASLDPNPSETLFTTDGTWFTYLVTTTADSILVTVNESGTDVVLEIAGGRNAPTRNYCGPEPNDHPSRARRNGWNLHLAACGTGNTQVVLTDFYYGVELGRYPIHVGHQGEIDEPDE